VHPDIAQSSLIEIIPLIPSPSFLQTSNKLLVLAFAPLKAIWQAAALYYVLGYRCKPAKWIMIQNPPFIPTFAVASVIAFFRRSRLVMDWHNFGYSLYALKFGDQHPLVKLHRWYELNGTRSVSTHLTVTNAMARFLRDAAKITAHALHDRPPKYFQPLNAEQRSLFVKKFGPTKYRKGGPEGKMKLIVSSTSWTPDEDFSLLLNALVEYSTASISDKGLPRIVAIITGKGPLKEFYLKQVEDLENAGKLSNVEIHTAWLSNEDYATLLGSADLGVSLHKSSSGLDLPMKVVDMFGTGLPVLGWSAFEAWSELVREGVNGMGFDSASGLAGLLKDLCHDGGTRLAKLREGAMRETDNRWDTEWDKVAGRIFGLVE